MKPLCKLRFGWVDCHPLTGEQREMAERFDISLALSDAKAALQESSINTHHEDTTRPTPSSVETQ